MLVVELAILFDCCLDCHVGCSDLSCVCGDCLITTVVVLIVYWLVVIA